MKIPADFLPFAVDYWTGRLGESPVEGYSRGGTVWRWPEQSIWVERYGREVEGIGGGASHVVGLHAGYGEVGISGRGCGLLGLGGLVQWVEDVQERCGSGEVRFLRLDGAVDVHNSGVEVADIHAFLVNRVKAKSIVHHGSGGVIQTVEVGRRGKYGNGLQVCIYDKAAEQGEVGDRKRCEARWFSRNGHADLVGREVFPQLHFGERYQVRDVVERLASYVRGAVQFVDRSDLGTWIDFVGVGPLAVMRPEVRSTSAGKQREWLRRSVSRALAAQCLVERLAGRDPAVFLAELVAQGEAVLSDADRAAAQREASACVESPF